MTADKLIFILMIIVALYIVSCRNYKRIIISLGAFSLLASFCYLMYHAPDVAIAEAVIGSALSTILFIVALKKHRTFYIYFTSGSKEHKSDYQLRADMEDVVSRIMRYCSTHDLEAQAVFTWEKPQSIASNQMFDLILHNNNDTITIYGSDAELHVLAIKDMLTKTLSEERIRFVTANREDSR